MKLLGQLCLLYVVLLGGYLFWFSPRLGLAYVALMALGLLIRMSPHVFFFMLGMFFGFRR